MDNDMQLRLCMIANTCAAGGRRTKDSKAALAPKFFCDSLPREARLLCSACIHCLSTMGAERVPRSFGPSLHGTKANDLVQFDYQEMGPINMRDKYIVMIRDDHSEYSWFYPSPSTAAEHAAHAPVDWCSAFRPQTRFMSDGPTHLQKKVLRQLPKALRTLHHFTTPYCPCSDGAME